MFLHEIIFSYSLTAIQILDFGYVKCTPDFAFIHSFLGIVFGQDVRRGMGKKLPKKMRNKYVVTIFDWLYRP